MYVHGMLNLHLVNVSVLSKHKLKQNIIGTDKTHTNIKYLCISFCSTRMITLSRYSLTSSQVYRRVSHHFLVKSLQNLAVILEDHLMTTFQYQPNQCFRSTFAALQDCDNYIRIGLLSRLFVSIRVCQTTETSSKMNVKDVHIGFTCQVSMSCTLLVYNRFDTACVSS